VNLINIVKITALHYRYPVASSCSYLWSIGYWKDDVSTSSGSFDEASSCHRWRFWCS